MKVLGRDTSINVRKVLWVCAELELPYEHEPWGANGLSLASPEFLALNPNGTIPVLRDGDVTIWESNTIIRYLANKSGADALYPPDAASRALVDMWMDWQIGELNPSWRYAFHGIVRKNPAKQDEGRIRESLQVWEEKMDILEIRLAETAAYITGDAFCLADIPIGLAVNRWFMTPGTSTGHSAAAAYYDRLTERPGYMRCGRNGMP